MIIILTSIVLILWLTYIQISRRNFNEKPKVIAFFHPNCNDAGGGERVLWFIISRLQKKFPEISLKIYTCDFTPAEKIIERAIYVFNVTIDAQKLEFLHLKTGFLISYNSWPLMTLLMRHLSTFITAIESLRYGIPDIVIDTSGFFVFPLALKIFGCSKTGAYVHVPIKTTEKIEESLKINKNILSLNFIVNLGKKFYFNIFMLLYKLSGYSIDLVMVNSKYTEFHMKNHWCKKEHNCVLVYPSSSPEIFKPMYPRKNIILSISHFRPTKNHTQQIDIMAHLINNFSEAKKFKLYLVGSLLPKESDAYIKSLKKYSQEKGVDEYVEFKINVDFADLTALMSTALIGVHSMIDEEFGIGMVQMMASGVIVIAHNSGGPKFDIMKDFNNKKVGFLADSVLEYSNTIAKIMKMSEGDLENLRTNSIKSVRERYSDEIFNSQIDSYFNKLII